MVSQFRRQRRRLLGVVECRCLLVVLMWVWTCQTRVMVLVVWSTVGEHQNQSSLPGKAKLLLVVVPPRAVWWRCGCRVGALQGPPILPKSLWGLMGRFLQM